MDDVTTEPFVSWLTVPKSSTLPLRLKGQCIYDVIQHCRSKYNSSIMYFQSKSQINLIAFLI